MTEHPPAEVLRHQLVTFRKNNRFAPYPPPIRRQAIQYANARTIQGATPSTIAAELGVATTTVSLWTHSTRSKSADAPAQTSPSELPLVPLVLRPAPQIPGPSQIVVHFADGTSLQACGFGQDSLARTIEILRKER